jgi:hypothetical protein
LPAATGERFGIRTQSARGFVLPGVTEVMSSRYFIRAKLAAESWESKGMDVRASSSFSPTR